MKVREKESGGGGGGAALFIFGCWCVCFVFLFRLQHALLKSQTHLWPGCCAGSFTPTVLWKQTQVQGQVLLLFWKSFPTSSIPPLALISTALIWDCLSQLVRGLLNCNFLRIGEGNEERKLERGWTVVPTLTFTPRCLKHLQMIHCHLQYFSLFQLSRSLQNQIIKSHESCGN